MGKVQIDDLPDQTKQLILRAVGGESILITQEGQPVAEIISLRELRAPWKRHIQKAVLPDGVQSGIGLREERDERRICTLISKMITQKKRSLELTNYYRSKKKSSSAI